MTAGIRPNVWFCATPGAFHCSLRSESSVPLTGHENFGPSSPGGSAARSGISRANRSRTWIAPERTYGSRQIRSERTDRTRHRASAPIEAQFGGRRAADTENGV